MIHTEQNRQTYSFDEAPDLPLIPQYEWFYYDEEADVNRLINSCNTKGIRERRLNENLRKIAERLKLKKMKKPKIDQHGLPSVPSA
jgi:hypothetical protein